jgi:excisionase family DNA binding protein
MIPELLTIQEAAEALRLSKEGIKQLLKQGVLPAVRLPAFRRDGGLSRRAGRVLLRASDIRELVEKCTVENGQKRGGYRTRTATHTQP